MKLSFLTIILLVISLIGVHSQQSSTMVVNTDRIIAPIQPTMWGIFFEDINFAADGGVYAELVKNRSFEFSQPLMGWKELNENKSGSVLVINRSESNPANPRYIHVEFDNSKGKFGLSNGGFRGMGVKEGMEYHFSLLTSQVQGEVSLKLELITPEGKIIGRAVLIPGQGDWKHSEVSIKAEATAAKAQLNIWFEGKGSLDADMISLFPDDTWKHRPGGLRADLVQLLAEMKPGFIRFPGGCIVEGRELTNRYQWKKTIGKPEDRTLIMNRWNVEFSYRNAPDYFQSFGLGFFEYFQLAEDIGAEPLPILNCGMACQYNTGEVVPLTALDPYIQDALDLIEFANGPADSPWGKVRADMGHPLPFHLKMMGVGNEQWGTQYFERYAAFVKVIKSKYPDIKIITGTGPYSDGEMFDLASSELKKLNADIVDEHYYKKPAWFLQQAKRYDQYDRKGYKVFAGEYAAHSEGESSPAKNMWESALAEAAFMTGLERNADVVYMASYAPLFAHLEAWQWAPDLIWFDNLKSYGTPNYYVQKLFSTNKGTDLINILKDGKPVSGEDGLYASAVIDQPNHEIIIKIVNVNNQPVTQIISLQTKNKLESMGKMMILGTLDKNAVNSIDSPRTIAPVEKNLSVKGKELKLSIDPQSLMVLRIKLK